jgi:glyoxylase I family protein
MLVHHLATLVRDLEASERFYAGVLGLAVRTRHVDTEGHPRSVWLEIGHGAFLALERTDGVAVREDSTPGWHCVALGIAREERESWRERLAEAGHPVERETDFTLYARDPDGAIVALSHYPQR